MPTMKTPFGRLDGRYVNVEGDSMSGALDILDASNPQLRLTHTDGSVYADFQVDGNHDLLIKTSATGQVKFQPTTDQADFLQILDADGGNPILNIDAVNELVGVGVASPAARLDVRDAGIVPYNGYVVAIHADDANPNLLGLFNDAISPSVPQFMYYIGSDGKMRQGTIGARDMYFFTNGYTNTRMAITGEGDVGINTAGPDRKLDILDASNPQLRLTHTDGSVYTDFQTDASGIQTITPTGLVVKTAASIYPATDDTYYLGKNDDDTPFAWKGLIVKDTSDGKYYRIETVNGVVTATDLTD